MQKVVVFASRKNLVRFVAGASQNVALSALWKCCFESMSAEKRGGLSVRLLLK